MTESKSPSAPYQDPSGYTLVECLQAVERALSEDNLNPPQARHFVKRALNLAQSGDER